MIGVADMQSEIPLVEEIIAKREGSIPRTSLRISRGLVWDALRASARLGNKAHCTRVLELVDAVKPERDRKFLFSDLSYVLDSAVVEYLWNWLLTDDVTTYPSRDTVDESYARFAAKALYDMLDGFPDQYPYTDEKMRECRAWMAAQATWPLKR
jgi:hypothetical protein